MHNGVQHCVPRDLCPLKGAGLGKGYQRDLQIAKIAKIYGRNRDASEPPEEKRELGWQFPKRLECVCVGFEKFLANSILTLFLL